MKKKQNPVSIILPPDEQRCCKTDGVRWRCKNFRMHHSCAAEHCKYCEKHCRSYVKQNLKRCRDDDEFDFGFDDLFDSDIETNDSKCLKLRRKKPQLTEEDELATVGIQPPANHTSSDGVVGGGSTDIWMKRKEVETTSGELQEISPPEVALESMENYKTKYLEIELSLGIENKKIELKWKEIELERKEIEREKKEIELERTKVEIEKKNVELEKNKVEPKEVKIELEKKNVELEEMKIELEKKNVELEEMKLELEKNKVEPEEMKSKIEKNNVELEEMKIQLEKKNVELEKKNLEPGEIKIELEKKNVDLEEMRIELEKKNVELEKKNLELEEIKIELEKKNVNLEEMRIELGKKNVELEKKNLELEEIKIELEKKNVELEKNKLEYSELQGKYDEECRKNSAKNDVDATQYWRNKCSDLETVVQKMEIENSMMRCEASRVSNLKSQVLRIGNDSSILRCEELRRNSGRIESEALGLQNDDVTPSGGNQRDKNYMSKPNAESSCGGRKDSHVYDVAITKHRAVDISSACGGENIEQRNGWGCLEEISSQDQLDMSKEALAKLVSDGGGESLGDFEDFDSSTDSQNSLGDLMDMLAMRNSNNDKEMKWKSEPELLSSFEEDPELCMKAVCALYRQEISEEEASPKGLHFDSDTLRCTTVAKILMDKDCKGDMKKSLEELERLDSKAVDDCKKLAKRYSMHLFDIYKNRKDPFFCPATTAGHGDQTAQ